MGREWPPVSVWLTAVFILGPVAAAAADDVWAGCVVGGLSGFGVVAVPLLLRGSRTGYALAVLSVMVQCGLLLTALLMAVVVMAASPDTPWLTLLQWGGAWVLLVAVQAGLLRWPETRRWCGDRPPAPDAD